MTSPERPASLASLSGPGRGVHCGAVMLEPARVTCSKEVALGSGVHLCLEQYFYSKFSREPSRAN